jgi:hypothetical protein
MKLLFKSFFQGIILGILIILFTVVSGKVLAQESLSDQIRTSFEDPRDLIPSIPDPRDENPKPCEEDPREGCARPAPRPSQEPSIAPSVDPTISPTTIPSSQPGSSPAASSGTGGTSTTTNTNTETIKETVKETVIEKEVVSLVKGLSFTGSKL